MSPVVFDDAQLSAMGRAIDQLMKEADLTRYEVARAVFSAAREDGEFDPAKLARMATENLALRNKLSVLKSQIG